MITVEFFLQITLVACSDLMWSIRCGGQQFHTNFAVVSAQQHPKLDIRTMHWN